MFSAIFLATTCLIAISGIYFIKKSNKPLAGIGWIMTGVIGLTCWHALVAGIIFLFSIPVTSWAIGIADLLLGGALWFVVWRQRGIQHYEYRVADGVVAAGLTVFVAVFFKLHNGGLRFNINFATVDPAPRIMEAIDVATRHTIHAMYYHALTNGLLMDILGPLTSVDYYYKIFVFSGGLFLGFAGLMFYVTVRRFLRNRLITVAGVAVMALFVCAYPLNATLYGFVYLGMGVVIVGYLVFVMDSYLRDDLSLGPAVGLLMLGCLGMITCYAMFAPVMYIAVIWLFWMKQKKHGRLFTRETVLACLAIFLLPIVLGLWYTYGGVFTAGVTIGDAINSEGAGYRDLFSNFVAFVPLAMFGFIQIWRRDMSAAAVMLPLTAVFMLGLFGMGLVGKVSSYYFYKSYNLLWFAVMYLVVAGIASIANRETAVLVAVYGIVFALVFGFAVSGVDYKLSKRYPLFNPTDKADLMNDIYIWNKVTVRAPGGIDPDQQDLYHYVYDNFTAKDTQQVPIISYWQDAFWYQAISNQRNHDWNEAGLGDPATAMNNLSASNAKYVLVLTGESSLTYHTFPVYFDSLPHVYENSAGFIAELPV